jgi:peptidoglycan/LPS O-acetylase OafA/YrhL
MICLGLAWPLAFVLVSFADRIPQDPAFHAFAPSGSWWGIPHFWNVSSNLALVAAGGVGLVSVSRSPRRNPNAASAVFFVGLVLTGFGSAYYHLDPTDRTLIWDRLPMTIAFMALFIAVAGACLESRSVQRLLPVALLVGAASVLWWAWSEAHGVGDLRYYAVVQFLPLLLVPLLLAFRPPRDLRARWIWIMILLYGGAKLCEYLDTEIAALLPFGFTGHGVKHLLSGASGFAFRRSLLPA